MPVNLAATAKTGGCLDETHLPNILEGRFLCRVLPNDLIGLEVDVDSRVAYPYNNIIQSQEEPTEEEHALLVNAQLGAVDGYAVVIQLALVQDDFVEEEDRIAPLQQLKGNLLIRGLQRRLVGG